MIENLSSEFAEGYLSSDEKKNGGKILSVRNVSSEFIAKSIGKLDSISEDIHDMKLSSKVSKEIFLEGKINMLLFLAGLCVLILLIILFICVYQKLFKD